MRFKEHNLDYYDPTETWNYIPFEQADLDLPANPGVYVVVAVKAVYVGESVNMRNRWKRHSMTMPCLRYGAHTIYYFETARHCELERHIIHALNPVLNSRNNSEQASKNYIYEYGTTPFIFRSSEWTL